MTSWFEYQGIHSRDMGVIVQRYPAPARPAQRVQTIQIPARFEALHKREGDYPVYDPADMQMDIAIIRGGDANRVLAWLRGDGELVLGNDPDYTRHVWMTDALALQAFGRRREIWTGTLAMEGAPYRMARQPQTIVPAHEDEITNPGDFEAYPLITIHGSGTCAITMGGRTITIEQIDETVTLDCAAKVAVTNGVSVSGTVSGEWPVIEAGTHAVAWSGTANGVTIAPRWRYV